jgi:hypothetical protein
MIAKPKDHRDPWCFIALARAKHSAKRPSRKTESEDARRNWNPLDGTGH